jgi:hypothetical protein
MLYGSKTHQHTLKLYSLIVPAMRLTVAVLNKFFEVLKGSSSKFESTDWKQLVSVPIEIIPTEYELLR